MTSLVIRAVTVKDVSSIVRIRLAALTEEEYVSAVARTVEDARKLIEAEFEYVTEMDEVIQKEEIEVLLYLKQVIGMSTETTKRYEKGTRRWWKSLGKVFAQKDKISFVSDGIAVIEDPEIRRLLDCKYIWIERVLTSGMSKEKRFWLPKMLSSEWLIVVMGKPNWKAGWEAIRPETYNRKALEEEEGIYELLQTIKWRKSRFYEEKYRTLHAKLKSLEKRKDPMGP